jgi:hypothetical protein
VRQKTEKEMRAQIRKLTRFYGITEEFYLMMHKEQGGACAVCKQPENAGKVMVIDHCHTTDEVRGLLCRRCNTLIGTRRDRHPSWFLAVHDYLTKNKSRPWD